MTIQEATDWCREQVGLTYGAANFFSLYYQLLTGRNPHADGVRLTGPSDAWMAVPSGFTKDYINPDDTDQLPPQGSIIFWNDGIAVVDYASAATITVWEDKPETGVTNITYNRSDRQELGWWVWNGFSEAPSLESDIIDTDPEPNGGAQPAKPEMIYTWVKYDNIWEVARRLGLRVVELLEHNGIEDPDAIKPGDVLHLPVPRVIEVEQPIRIEPLLEPRPMHPVRDTIRKWSFGYAHTVEDLRETGPTYASDANIDVLAIAHVPLRGIITDFYMERVALGDYLKTGRVRYTIGFKPEELADGHTEPPKRPLPKMMAATVGKIASQLESAGKTVAITNPLLQSAKPRVMDISPSVRPNACKATLHPLYPDRRTIRYFFLEDMTIEELDGRATPRPVKRYDAADAHYVDAQLGYYQNDTEGIKVEYILPVSHTDTGYFWKIPKDKLIEESDRTIKLAERDAKQLAWQNRRATHRLTYIDYFWWIPLAWITARLTAYTKDKQ